MHKSQQCVNGQIEHYNKSERLIKPSILHITENLAYSRCIQCVKHRLEITVRV
jgi:hypothetical protein